MQFNKIFHSFRARVFWYMLILIVLLSVTSTTVVIYQQKKIFQQDLVNKGLAVVRNLAFSSEIGVFLEEPSLLQPVMQQILQKEEDLLYAIVYNLQGDVIYSQTNNPEFNHHFKEDTAEIKKHIGKEPAWEKIILQNHDVYEFWAPILISKEVKEGGLIEPVNPLLKKSLQIGDVIGIVHATFSPQIINLRIKYMVWTNIGIAIAFLPIVLLLVFFISTVITKPLQKLKNGVETIEKNGQYEKIEIEMPDEISDLAASFNRMVDSLEKKDEKINQHLQELASLNMVASVVNQSLDLKITLQEALREVLKVTKMEAGWVYFPGTEGELNIAAYQGTDVEFIHKIDHLKLEEGLAGKVATSGEPIITEDISSDSRLTRTAVAEKGFHGFASIPLRAKDNVIGVMNITSYSTHIFTAEEKELLYSIGNQIGTAIENSQLYESLKKQLEETAKAQNQFARAARLAVTGELASNVAHEINNPLTGILAYTSMLMENMPETDPKRKKLNIIYEETMRIRYIVRNLLDFARQSDPKIEKVNIVDVIKDTLILVEHLAKVAEVKIIENFAQNLPYVFLDISQMKQVFINLFNNAFFAMPKGGQLTIKVFSNEEWMNIQIQDTGQGIPQNIIQKVFDPFFTTKPETKGTGLGLSISHSIIEKHGGKIEVESKVGQGSIFMVKLPLKKEI